MLFMYPFEFSIVYGDGIRNIPTPNDFDYSAL